MSPDAARALARAPVPRPCARLACSRLTIQSWTLKRILVVDDEPFICITVWMLLRLEGYLVASAADGRAGLQRGLDTLPDVILSDVNMPYMGGYQLLAAIRSHPALDRTRIVRLNAEVDSAVATPDMFGDDTAIVAAVLKTFADSMTASLVELSAALGQDDEATLVSLAHKIKGAARMSGALALAAAAVDLEHIARAGGDAQRRKAAKRLEFQWGLLRDHPALHGAV
jgi:CheY-like chemotaxis protein